MTEQEWLACPGPYLLLEFMNGRASDRKLRLFAIECCRRVWHLLVDERSQRAVEAAERFAEESIQDMGELVAAYHAASAARDAIRPEHQSWDAAMAGAFHAAQTVVWACSRDSRHWEASTEATKAVRGAAAAAQCHEKPIVDAVRQEQAMWLRDLFGPLPFRPVSVDSSWFSWNNGTIPELAHGIYDERSFDHLPILADALEEAGCTDADILNHCRQPGEHVRGCWVVDLIMQRN